MSYKLIRELNKYEQDDDIPASGYLVAASNPDGTPAEETYRMSVKDIVSEYNREVAKEQAEKAAAGDSLMGSTFSEVQVINGQEVLVDATPITAANIDSLVDPGSGLEVVEICYDISKNTVPCTINGQPNPAVKYKQKKLSFAKSASSKSITLYVNSNTGISYGDNPGSFKVASSGAVDQRFLNLRDAFLYMNAEVVSTSITINIYLETDTEEPWFYGNGYMTALKFKKINVYGADAADQNLRRVHVKHGVGVTYVDPSQVSAANLNEMNAQWNGVQQFRHGQYRARATTANPNPTDQATLPAGVVLTIHACCPFWVGSDIYWRGIHFTIELHGEAIFAQYRQVNSQVYFAQCKFSTKSYTRPDINAGIPSTSSTKVGISHYFDIRDNSTMHVLNVTDGTAFQDFSGRAWKGIDTSGLELDLSEVSFIYSMFLIEKGSGVQIIEYQAGSHAANGQAARTFPARLTITSPIVNCTNWFHMVNSSFVTANAPIVVADHLTGGDINVEYALKAEGFNTIRMWGYTDDNGTSQPHVIPGLSFENKGSGSETTVNVDYRNTSNVLNGTNTLKFYSQYYDNFTNWATY